MQTFIDLTEAQQADLMHLRRLFYGRLGQLLRERKELLSKVHTDITHVTWTPDTVPGTAEVADQLRANGIAEYKTYMQFASTFFRGVCSMMLWAMHGLCMVQCLHRICVLQCALPRACGEQLWFQ